MKTWKWAAVGLAAVFAGVLSRPAEAPMARVGNKVAGSVARMVAPASQPNIVFRVYQYAMEDRLFAVAASVAFYALLALAPALAVAVSLFGLFANPERIADLPTALSPMLPPDAVALIHGEAQRLVSQAAQALSVKLAVGLLISIWSASAAVRASFDALNVIDEQEETRSIFGLYATALAATLGGLVVLLVAIALIGANPQFFAFGFLSRETIWLYGLLRWPAFFCIAVFSLTVLYWIGPSRRPAKFLRLLPGAAIAALIWAVGSYAFSWYVATLAHYTATYGSLATVVVLMTWLWLSAAIMLLGAQINFALSEGRAGRKPREKPT